MAFNIDEFRGELERDGARPNLFNITLILPATVLNAGATSQKLTFMARATQLPGSTVGTVPLFYFGREVKLAGNRTFPEWTIQVINDEDFLIRNSMENWMNGLNSHVGNLREPTFVNSLGYSTDAVVTQFAKTGEIAKQYNIVSLFPVDVMPIDLDWGSNDTVEEFSVSFQYQYWTAVPITT